jgi:hypothetical protein
MNKRFVLGVTLGLLLASNFLPAQTFSVTFPQSLSGQPLDGRLLLLLSTESGAEPRFQIDDTPRSQVVFGVTVDGWRAEEPRWLIPRRRVIPYAV